MRNITEKDIKGYPEIQRNLSVYEVNKLIQRYRLSGYWELDAHIDQVFTPVETLKSWNKHVFIPLYNAIKKTHAEKTIEGNLDELFEKVVKKSVYSSDSDVFLKSCYTIIAKESKNRTMRLYAKMVLFFSFLSKVIFYNLT